MGKHWNRKFIRAIQAIINVTKGIVAPSRNTEKGDFFKKAFGKNLDEFHEILYMPENYIVYRKLFEEELGYTQEWQFLFREIQKNKEKFEVVKRIIEENDFSDYQTLVQDSQSLDLLKHYSITRDMANSLATQDKNHSEIKKEFDKLIKTDNLLNLTLTYDYS